MEAALTTTVPFDYAAAARRLRRRAAEREAVLRERLERVRRDAAAIVERIVLGYEPTRVWQWGSLLHGRGFSEVSDIDIAVEGVTNPRRFFAMLADAEDVTSFPVDLVQMERIDPLHAESIRRKGRLVYERAES
ncbi:MAG: nucleotidyltransferase domain-containing protein [Lentisphaeria bacterium]|nr:nucleotidyltransferase domain-containing protein [Lentisphaeria bacterium]